MSQARIDEILQAKQREREKQAAGEGTEGQQDKFFSVLLGEGLQEHFLELRFRDGTRTCFSYTDLGWFNFNPEDGIDLDFGGFLISIKGRGFEPKLFNSIKAKRVAWVKEADLPLQDHKDNECFIEEITITPPDGFAGEEAEEA